MTIDDGINQLARLAEERGHITYREINDTFPDNLFSIDNLDEIYVKLCERNIQILDLHENPARD